MYAAPRDLLLTPEVVSGRMQCSKKLQCGQITIMQSDNKLLLWGRFGKWYSLHEEEVNCNGLVIQDPVFHRALGTDDTCRSTAVAVQDVQVCVAVSVMELWLLPMLMSMSAQCAVQERPLEQHAASKCTPCLHMRSGLGVEMSPHSAWNLLLPDICRTSAWPCPRARRTNMNTSFALCCVIGVSLG